MAKQKKEITSISIDSDLKERAKVRAANQKRSLTAHVEFLLEADLNSMTTKP